MEEDEIKIEDTEADGAERRFICDAPKPAMRCMGRPLVYFSQNKRKLQPHNRSLDSCDDGQPTEAQEWHDYDPEC